MNRLVATVKQIETIDNLNIVHFDFASCVLIMMSLGLREDIKIGVKVALTVKSSHIMIAKVFSGSVGDANQLKAKVVALEDGKLLSSIKLKLEEEVLESIMISKASQKMGLQVGDDVTVFISPSELSILEVL